MAYQKLPFFRIDGKKYKDFTGIKINHLTAIRFISNNNGNVIWEFRCDCGKSITKNHRLVFSEHVKDCGCRKNERYIRNVELHKTHKSSKTRLYSIWSGMKNRCAYHAVSTRHTKHYFDRGIKVCDEWQRFENFKNWALSNGYQDNLSIDRIDVNGNYCPENCRWATNKQQANNKSNNRWIEYKGETHTLSEWADIIGVSRKKLHDRLEDHSVEEAFTMPSRPHNVMITYKGETHNIKEWAEIKHLPYTALNQRISILKWDIEKALNTPLLTNIG